MFSTFKMGSKILKSTVTSVVRNVDAYWYNVTLLLKNLLTGKTGVGSSTTGISYGISLLASYNYNYNFSPYGAPNAVSSITTSGSIPSYLNSGKISITQNTFSTSTYTGINLPITLDFWLYSNTTSGNSSIVSAGDYISDSLGNSIINTSNPVFANITFTVVNATACTAIQNAQGPQGDFWIYPASSVVLAKLSSTEPTSNNGAYGHYAGLPLTIRAVNGNTSNTPTGTVFIYNNSSDVSRFDPDDSDNPIANSSFGGTYADRGYTTGNPSRKFSQVRNQYWVLDYAPNGAGSTGNSSFLLSLVGKTINANLILTPSTTIYANTGTSITATTLSASSIYSPAGVFSVNWQTAPTVTSLSDYVSWSLNANTSNIFLSTNKTTLQSLGITAVAGSAQYRKYIIANTSNVYTITTSLAPTTSNTWNYYLIANNNNNNNLLTFQNGNLSSNIALTTIYPQHPNAPATANIIGNFILPGAASIGFSSAQGTLSLGDFRYIYGQSLVSGLNPTTIGTNYFNPPTSNLPYPSTSATNSGLTNTAGYPIVITANTTPNTIILVEAPYGYIYDASSFAGVSNSYFTYYNTTTPSLVADTPLPNEAPGSNNAINFINTVYGGITITDTTPTSYGLFNLASFVPTSISTTGGSSIVTINTTLPPNSIQPYNAIVGVGGGMTSSTNPYIASQVTPLLPGEVIGSNGRYVIYSSSTNNQLLATSTSTSTTATVQNLAFTIECWVKITSAATVTPQYIWSQYGTGTTPAMSMRYVYNTGFGFGTFNFYIGGSAQIVSSQGLSTNTWYYLTLTRSPAPTVGSSGYLTGNYYMFINGSYQGTATSTSTAYSSGTTNSSFVIGYNPGATFGTVTGQFRGEIIDLRITKSYNRYPTSGSSFLTPVLRLPTQYGV